MTRAVIIALLVLAIGGGVHAQQRNFGAKER